MRQLIVITLLTGLVNVSAAASRASADTEVNLRMPGITVIGEYGTRTWAVTLSLLGCSWRALGEAPLTDDLVVHGTDSDETIRVLQTPMLWCNRILQPVTQNGHAIRVHGGDGDDTIYGGGSAPFSGNPNAIFGEDGDDTLYVGPGGARAEGGSGADQLYGGDSPGDELLGGAGDDVLCERADIEPLTLDGGEDEDVSCSAAATNDYVNIERVDCAPCGAGYR